MIRLSALRHGGVRCFLFAGVGGEGEEAVADFAVEAFVGFAVLASQFDESLRGECVAAGDAGEGELLHYCVVFGAQAFKQGYGSVGEGVVVEHFGASVEQRCHGVDEQDVDASVAEGSCWCFACAGKGVVCSPVAVELHAEQLAHFFFGFCGYDVGKEVESAFDVVCQHGYAAVREVLRAHSCQFPGV